MVGRRGPVRARPAWRLRRCGLGRMRRWCAVWVAGRRPARLWRRPPAGELPCQERDPWAGVTGLRSTRWSSVCPGQKQRNCPIHCDTLFCGWSANHHIPALRGKRFHSWHAMLQRPDPHDHVDGTVRGWRPRPRPGHLADSRSWADSRTAGAGLAARLQAQGGLRCPACPIARSQVSGAGRVSAPGRSAGEVARCRCRRGR
jgi:hypothetical protein